MYELNFKCAKFKIKFEFLWENNEFDHILGKIKVRFGCKVSTEEKNHHWVRKFKFEKNLPFRWKMSYVQNPGRNFSSIPVKKTLFFTCIQDTSEKTFEQIVHRFETYWIFFIFCIFWNWKIYFPPLHIFFLFCYTFFFFGGGQLFFHLKAKDLWYVPGDSKSVLLWWTCQYILAISRSSSTGAAERRRGRPLAIE